MKQKLTKDSIPEGFTLSMALVDAIPVVFFGASAVTIGVRFGSVLFLLGSALCLIGGIGKVLWKIIAAVLRRNIWPLFVQMRILMPAGFLLMLLSLIVNRSRINMAGIGQAFLQMPSFLFFLAGIIGMCLMIVFAKVLNSADPTANWIEQLTNGIAQLAFFLGLLLLH